MKEFENCCICNKKIIGYGNNPDGACWKDTDGKIVVGTFTVNDRCCDECNSKFVIPGRLYLLYQNRNNNNN